MEPVNTNEFNFRNELKLFRLMFFSIAGSVVLFTGVVLLVSSFKDMKIPALAGNEVFIIMILLTVVSILLAFRSYNNGISNLPDAATPVQERVVAYRKVIVKFLAFCEFPAMLSGILLMLTGSMNLIIIIAVCVAVMLLKWPTAARMETDLQLTWQEKQDL